MNYILRLTNYFYKKLTMFTKEMDKYPEKANKEFIYFMVSDKENMDIAKDFFIPYQIISSARVIADKRSIVDIVEKLKPDERIIGSGHQHPFSNFSFLSYTDKKLMETTLDELAVNNMIWIELDEHKLLPELELKAEDKPADIKLDGKAYKAKKIELSPTYLSKRPIAYVYAIVNGTDINGSRNNFYGQCLVREYSITSGKVDNEWIKEIDIEILPPSTDEPEIDEKELKEIVETRLVVQSYRVKSEIRTKEDQYNYYDTYYDTHNTYGYSTYPRKNKSFETYQEYSKKYQDIEKRLDEITNYLEDIQAKINTLVNRIGKYYV